MKLSLFGRFAMALFASLVLGLGMTACGGGTIAYMYVLGQQYNQVAGFKVDDYTGNLTQIINSPFASNGSNPVSIVVKPGGRFVFVLNQGTGASSSSHGTSGGVSVFSVGGDGVLTFLATYSSQGYDPIWLQMDTTGNFLYVLDKYAPSYVAGTGQYTGPNIDGNGAITSFSVDSTTGRLSLVTNSQILNGGVNTPFFEVGGAPIMMKTAGNCLLTVNSANNSISPYSFAGSGQLAFVGATQQYLVTGANKITSINGNGSYVYLTDFGANTIDPFSIGSSCSLTPVAGGNEPNISGSSGPVYSLLDSTNKYLYVLNQSTTIGTSQAASSITAFTVNTTNGQLQALNTYSVGSGPVCMVEDPTNEYMYISDHNDGTVTGKLLDPTTGILSSLTRGSTFQATGLASCLAINPNVD